MMKGSPTLILRPVLMDCGPHAVTPVLWSIVTFAVFVWSPERLDESCFHIYWNSSYFLVFPEFTSFS